MLKAPGLPYSKAQGTPALTRGAIPEFSDATGLQGTALGLALRCAVQTNNAAMISTGCRAGLLHLIYHDFQKRLKCILF